MNMKDPRNLKAITMDAIALSRKVPRCKDKRKPLLQDRCDRMFLAMAEFPNYKENDRLFKVWLQQTIPVRVC